MAPNLTSHSNPVGRNNGGSKRATAVASAFCATLVMMLPEVSAKRFIVGGNMGWTSDVNYTLWAEYQTFYLGNWLFFVYDRNQDDVIEVNKTNYETCNAKHPVHNYTTGSGRDVVTLNVTHDRYFISSKRSCHGGMRLQVHLTPIPQPAPLPQPAHLAPLPPPPVYLAPKQQPPRAAPSRSYSSRFTVLKSQLLIPFFVTIAAI
ncbi:putative Phytocyanin domain, cupredoxin [Helianthus annuus]|uniref:Phytocyanin domain, cupredoxin n=2 Tax=Helianthus annuus TaxID=4232 RepID=A0A251TYA4_HELAN|nr:putative Phytocyanin domain, cupredoxin [Helianthus annuus]KAJ0526989.1 putative Phytocyanin domain, cupredoxin [Helianthus annuus]KAJ0543383.1 putative Phytocyanin domain, cupredoxin [Helianthus annuus]KAJ0708441.1 putative Phytocyanin domain, cupredoxin [Helianthus annuus]KAJ0712368.1 putative Phytocyanin domain, cupredoxin [Helianthus annuus]